MTDAGLIPSIPTIDDTPVPPMRTDRGIGLIGCGGIVNYAHLPSYKQHGLAIAGCFDLNPDAARSTARAFDIPVVHSSIADLLADPAVAIVDIAVHPDSQPELALQAIAAGKHLLCQKPLGLTPARARLIVDAARDGGVKAAVNQQMRWAGGVAAARQIVDSGFIGEPTDILFQISVETPWHMWPWLRDSPQLEVMFHSIHYLDSIRYLIGNPVTVTSRHGKAPNQPERAETRTTTILEFANGSQAVVLVNHHNHSGAPIARFRILGTEGVIESEIGLLATYPDGTIDTIRFRRNDEPADTWHNSKLSTLWMPDAFIGPMASLMNAVESGSEPLTSVADNLDTIRVVTAAYRSMAENRSIPLAEVVD